MTSRARGMISAAVVVLLAAGVASAQEVAMNAVRYLKGQSVQPVFEGWSRNADGSYNMWFGYLNRNFEERPHIPVGPDNGFGGGEDLGQPTYFQIRRQQFAFKVVLPATWPKDKDLVWTVKANGTTLKAFGSLWPVWEMDNNTISANRGSRTAIDFDEAPNTAPTIVSAPPDQTLTLGRAATLTMQVTDDGLPKPRRNRGGSVAGLGRAGGAAPAEPPLNQSLRVTWVQYRGDGTVKFDPPVVRVADGKATTLATFDKPGAYVLRAYAEDGGVFTERDVNVTVTAPGAAQD